MNSAVLPSSQAVAQSPMHRLGGILRAVRSARPIAAAHCAPFLRDGPASVLATSRLPVPFSGKKSSVVPVVHALGGSNGAYLSSRRVDVPTSLRSLSGNLIPSPAAAGYALRAGRGDLVRAFASKNDAATGGRDSDGKGEDSSGRGSSGGGGDDAGKELRGEGTGGGSGGAGGASDGAGGASDVDFMAAVIIDEGLAAELAARGQTEKWKALAEELRLDAASALALAMEEFEEVQSGSGVAAAEMSVLLCTDAYIRELNREWRGVDAPTDVLSFPQDQPAGLSPLLLLGDVIISVETAQRQANERGHSLLDELRILMVHGMLHLLGYDHEAPKGSAADSAISEAELAAAVRESAEQMATEELRILEAFAWRGTGLVAAAIGEEGGGAAEGKEGRGEAGREGGEEGRGEAGGEEGEKGGVKGRMTRIGMVQGWTRFVTVTGQGEEAALEEGGSGLHKGKHKGKHGKGKEGKGKEKGKKAEKVLDVGAEKEREHKKGKEKEKEKEKGDKRRTKKPPFQLLLCDMDGTLLNSASKISPSTAEALRAAHARGVRVAIATGKARPAAMSALGAAGLVGSAGIFSDKSPGVFLQGLRVYGKGGLVVHNALLPNEVTQEGFEFALKHGKALIGFCGDRCVTLVDHPLVEALHTIYYEPRAEVMPSVHHIMNETPIQKLLFYDTPHGIDGFIRPFWSAATAGRATVTQAVPDMLEILPPGQSKGAGVRVLLDHLEFSAEEVMAIGDGENDLEMIEMVGWGVAMANGSEKTKAVAKATVASNDEDGIAEAIEKFIL